MAGLPKVGIREHINKMGVVYAQCDKNKWLDYLDWDGLPPPQ
jgi:hypothetical protein